MCCLRVVCTTSEAEKKKTKLKRKEKSELFQFQKNERKEKREREGERKATRKKSAFRKMVKNMFSIIERGLLFVAKHIWKSIELFVCHFLKRAYIFFWQQIKWSKKNHFGGCFFYVVVSFAFFRFKYICQVIHSNNNNDKIMLLLCHRNSIANRIFVWKDDALNHWQLLNIRLIIRWY